MLKWSFVNTEYISVFKVNMIFIKRKRKFRLKTVSKGGDLSSTIAMTALCFGALSEVRAIAHCVIDQERDLL